VVKRKINSCLIHCSYDNLYCSPTSFGTVYIQDGSGHHSEFGFGHNFGVDQNFFTKFGTVMGDEQPR